MQDNQYKIEKVNYDIITQASNLNPVEKSKLFGFMNHYVAIRYTPNGHDILIETLGARDECKKALKMRTLLFS